MTVAFFFPFLLLMITNLWAKDLDEEKTYSEKLMEAYSEKLKKSKELYEKGVKVASEKYTKTLEGGRDISGKSKDWLLKDLQNIGDWEYKIESFDLKNLKDLEIRLNQLGAERWQCFWVEQSAKGKVFYFKRTKLSYLSKIPTGAMLRIMSDFGNE